MTFGLAIGLNIENYSLTYLKGFSMRILSGQTSFPAVGSIEGKLSTQVATLSDVVCNVCGRGDGAGTSVFNLQSTFTIRLAGSARK